MVIPSPWERVRERGIQKQKQADYKNQIKIALWLEPSPEFQSFES